MLTDKELETINPRENLKNRPQWDEYFLAMAYIVAQRSFDPSSKCGTVIVSKDKRPLSTGYNGPIKGSIDEEIPLTRPERYSHMLHGEENALLAYNGSYQDIQGAVAYITGRPCSRCLRMLLQKGIAKIIYGKNDTKLVDGVDMKAQELMLKHHPEVEIRLLPLDGIEKVLKETLKYIDTKKKIEPNY